MTAGKTQEERFCAEVIVLSEYQKHTYTHTHTPPHTHSVFLEREVQNWL